jgi:hypothetical protein
MTFVNLGLIFVLAVARLWASDIYGKEARAEASRYPASVQQTQLSIGAQWLTVEQIRQSFSTELHRSVLVVEVAVYPAKGRSIYVSRSAFTIRPAGSDKASKPLHPGAVAQTAERRSGEGLDTNVYQQVGIGYERGSVSDPDTGQERKESRVYTSTGAGTGIGTRGGPARTERDREVMELELTEKGLPEGTVSRPVAGYLYFPSPGKKKSNVYQLECTLGGVKTVLALRASP